MLGDVQGWPLEEERTPWPLGDALGTTPMAGAGGPLSSVALGSAEGAAGLVCTAPILPLSGKHLLGCAQSQAGEHQSPELRVESGRAGRSRVGA